MVVTSDKMYHLASLRDLVVFTKACSLDFPSWSGFWMQYAQVWLDAQ